MAIVTITRGEKSGGKALAHRLADRLHYKCMSREVIAACARKYNIVEQELYDRLLEAPTFWERLTKEHMRTLIYIKCSLIEAAKQDNVIYHGYAGQLYLAGLSHVLKIRLDAPFEDRVKAAMTDLDKDHAAATEFIKKADEERSRWTKRLYGKEWQDPVLYDLSINLSNISLDAICDTVALLVNRDEFRATPESLNKLNALSLQSEVEAAIAADDTLWNQPVTVRASGSAVILHGSVKDKRIRDQIVEIASQVKGVTECHSWISFSSAPSRGGILWGD